MHRYFRPYHERAVFPTETGDVCAELDVTPSVASTPCAVCDGARRSLLTVFLEPTILSLQKEGTMPMPAALFERRHPGIVRDILNRLAAAGMGKPVCFECQQDFLVTGKNRFTAKGTDPQ
jgi:hypothetical protein